jgi:transcriptional regulator with XRE-family HTH domain
VSLPPLPVDPDFGRLAAKLEELRDARGLTYEELAEASGLSRRGIISLERGERHGNVGTWFKVANALGVKFGDLMAVLDD